MYSRVHVHVHEQISPREAEKGNATDRQGNSPEAVILKVRQVGFEPTTLQTSTVYM